MHKAFLDLAFKGIQMTPMMQQFWAMKSAHPDKILLFRMGDFYEMFHEDAIKAAPILGIALTVRNKKSEDQTKMCGVPHHSVASPINKLLAAGLKVAICDQLEDPKQAKGIVKRGITRILSPGMVYDPEELDAETSNYISAYHKSSLAFLESSTGDAFYYEDLNWQEVQDLLLLLRPAELLVSSTEDKKSFLQEKKSIEGPLITLLDVELETSRELCLHYSESMQARQSFRSFEKRLYQKNLMLSQLVVRNLEIFENHQSS